MTPRQSELLAFIRAYVAEHGFSPTYDEMLEKRGLASKSTVHRMVQLLIQQGKLTKMRGYRGLALTSLHFDLAPMPDAELLALAGAVAAEQRRRAVHV